MPCNCGCRNVRSFQSETGKQVVRNYNKVARTLVEYEVRTNEVTNSF